MGSSTRYSPVESSGVRASNKLRRTTKGGNRGRNYRKLTDEVYQEKRRKGLCFKCDKKFPPTMSAKTNTSKSC